MLNPHQNLSLLFNQLNRSFDETIFFYYVDKINNWKYYDVEQMQAFKIPKHFLKMFHINAYTLNKNFKDLKYLLKSTNINYDIIAISEIRNLEITKIINSKNYNFEYTLTEPTAAETMIYLANHLAYKPRHDLKNYKIN